MTYIVIQGVPGVGKTALTKQAGEGLGVSTFFETCRPCATLCSSALSV